MLAFKSLSTTIFLAIFASSYLLGQEDGAGVEILEQAPRTVENLDTTTEENLDTTTEEQDSFASQFIGAVVDTNTPILVGLLTAAIGYAARHLKARIDERNMFSDVRVKKGDRKNSIMIIGEGNAGKTTLIQSLCYPNRFGHIDETTEHAVHSAESKIDGTNYRYFVSDYRGQDLGTLVNSFIAKQLEPRTPMRFGYLNSLIIVIDCIGIENTPKVKHPDELRGDNIKRFNAFEKDRVDHQIQLWNRNALDAVFGMHNYQSLRLVCVFVNKVNLLNNENAKNELRDYLKPFVEDVEKRCSYYDEEIGKLIPYARFKFIMGSTMTGDGIVELNEALTKASVPD